jgi:hypothetical protein
MKTFTSFFTFILMAGTISAQQNDEQDYYSAAKPKLCFRERVSTSISAGGGLMFGSNGSAYTSYVAPKVSYQMSNRFKLNIGLMHYNISGNTFMPLNRSEALYNTGSQTASGNLVMVGGEYMLNKRVIISGAVMTNVSSLNKNAQPFKAATLGVEYKTSNNSSIRFETTVSQGQGNYYNANPVTGATPFTTGSGFQDSFGRSWMR